MNEDQFFNELKTSLGQAIEHAKGNQSKVRTKTIAIKELAVFSAEEIRELRLELKLTQKSFAALIGVSVKTIESWERGTNEPSGAARRLLEILRNEPDLAQKQEIVSV
ncbi:transcriptional regulator [Planococcus lenghuensis]|uniref:Transcriptional regulator n=2 Tax=Planococcus lenghuensis TaxID=2213202 RepID=A0A1Q2KVL0_9BACL|nr:transcriptional regulator [Planococcus lenghuensis]